MAADAVEAALRCDACFGRLPPRGAVPPFPADLGYAGGPLDGGYTHVSNVTIPAGYTYFLQFVLHDLTYGGGGRLELQSLYGDGPAGSPELYDPLHYGRLRTGKPRDDGTLPDLPRRSNGHAIVSDSRNDLTVMVGQVHMAFAVMHNRLLDQCRGRGGYERARAVLTRKYHRLVLDDLLPKIAGADIADAFARRRSPAPLAGLPAEFLLAAARVGHAMVKPRYRLNDRFEAPLFRPSPESPFGGDLRGQPLTDKMGLAWENFLPIGHPTKVQSSARINALLCRPFFDLPAGPESRPELRSMAFRTLAAGDAAGLPSGQCLARALGAAILPEEAIWTACSRYRGSPAPLWLYLMREADVEQHGAQFGTVGAAIFARVLGGAAASAATQAERINEDPVTLCGFMLDATATGSTLGSFSTPAMSATELPTAARPAA